MSSEYVTIKVPKDVVLAAKIPEEDFERVAKVELAIALYARGILSLGQARRLSGLSKWDFLEELAKHGVERHYTREELEDDLSPAEGLTRRRTSRFGVESPFSS